MSASLIILHGVVMELVTFETYTSFVTKFHASRDGARNEDTYSEASFVFLSSAHGPFVLHASSGIGIYWIGLQTASSRYTDWGFKFPSVERAVHHMLTQPDLADSVMYYSEDAVTRLRFIADHIQPLKEKNL